MVLKAIIETNGIRNISIINVSIMRDILKMIKIGPGHFWCYRHGLFLQTFFCDSIAVHAPLYNSKTQVCQSTCMKDIVVVCALVSLSYFILLNKLSYYAFFIVCVVLTLFPSTLIVSGSLSIHLPRVRLVLFPSPPLTCVHEN